MFKRFAQVVSIVSRSNSPQNTTISIAVTGEGAVTDIERDAIECCAQHILNGYSVVLSKEDSHELLRLRDSNEKLQARLDERGEQYEELKAERDKLQGAIDNSVNANGELFRMSAAHTGNARNHKRGA
ncbi:hypothetical protein HOT32_gp23 [Erwinia phage Faunus]|uniref:Uncharacterized protein n=1 Tax=Erwinia phage Faunus TaxID=2182346 RepID=A0A2U8UWH3_9CAUD|nr:hypothetical protein HOT32_gp23 [Erwinia phage Faunus]AWN08606.1 hypothetical protein [Erwinia phage Faunus]